MEAELDKENMAAGESIVGRMRKRSASVCSADASAAKKMSRKEYLMDAFEFEVSQALKAVYLDPRYRHRQHYIFLYNYANSISLRTLS